MTRDLRPFGASPTSRRSGFDSGVLYPRTRLLLAALLCPLLVLASCKLVDQRTFERAPTGPAAAALGRPELPTLPLLTITFAFADADWRPSVHEAVHAAQAHNPETTFDVITPVPIASGRDVQDAFVKRGNADAALVARELQASGVAADHITIGLRGDAGSPPREVLIYAR